MSWGNIRDKKISPIGIIKNIKNLPKKSNRIILEVRKRTGYVGEIKADSGFLENENYYKNLCNFFLYLKEKDFRKLFIKLHEVKSFWREKEQFLSHNSKLKFLDERSSMIKEINSAMLIIHTHCGTGHLESLSINKPTLILFTQDLNLLNAKTKTITKIY